MQATLVAKPERQGGLRLALGWLILPLAPAIVGSIYRGVMTFSLNDSRGPDPYDWEWVTWLMMIGPLIGYGFLAGATLGVIDEEGQGRIRGWFSRRSVWVTLGPWLGFLSAAAVVYILQASGIDRLLPNSPGWSETWVGWLIGKALGVFIMAWVAYGWTLVALDALRRARRQGQFSQSLRRGLAMAVAFAGSLFGTFWAITTLFREYFFDKRIMPLIVAASAMLLISGCASTVTYGEVRRRELFDAMLLAWLIGLALAWRWWSRARPRA